MDIASDLRVSPPSAPPPATDTPRPTGFVPIAPRAMAVLLIALGVIPTASYLTLAEPQRWWPGAVRVWIVWGIVLGATALLLGRSAGPRCEALAERIRARLLAPSRRNFSLFVALLTCALAVFFGWLLFRFHAATIDELS